MATEPFGSVGMNGRSTIVTGGGSGIGEATAKILALRGAAIIVADVDDGAGERVAAQIRDAGGKAAFVRTDVSDEAQVKRMVDFAVSKFGGLHAAFNNAGIISKGTSLIDMSREEWQRMMDVNLTGVFLCLKHEIAHMVKNGGGAIVNTSSGAGVIAVPHVVDYVASKHGVVGLTRSAAVDFSAQKVRVNALLPGGIETPLLMRALGQDPAVRAAVMQGHPIGRLGTPAEAGEAAAWLLSDAASFVTGAVFSVDGGYTTM